MYEDLLLQEIETLQLLDHPHIVRVMEILEDNENIYMASELMENGNLLQVFDKIKESNTPFTERDVANIIYQILHCIIAHHFQNS